jgi:hypothetical protein
VERKPLLFDLIRKIYYKNIYLDFLEPHGNFICIGYHLLSHTLVSNRDNRIRSGIYLD